MIKEIIKNYANQKNVVLTSSLIVLIMVIFGVVYITKDNENYDDITLNEIIEKCNKTTMQSKAKCVEEITKKFYKHNEITNAFFSFQKLRDEGGTSKHWAKYWCEIGDKYEYDINTDKIEIKKFEIGYGIIDFKTNMCIWESKEGIIYANNYAHIFSQTDNLNNSYKLIINNLNDLL
jgi:ABC-type multidrug transport system ATPase subunit